MAKKIVVIAAGGTGGHLFPAAAFGEEMFRRDWRVILMTDARGRRYAEGFPAERIEDVPAATLSANPLTAIPAMFKIARGIDAAKKRFREMPPSLVAGFGGYPSFPALMAARALHVPNRIPSSAASIAPWRRARQSSPAASNASIGFPPRSPTASASSAIRSACRS